MEKLTKRGTKAKQLSPDRDRDRIRDFSEYFFNPPIELGYINDIDFIFYMYRDGVLMDYALVEVSKADFAVNEKFLKAIHERYYIKGGQANFVKHKSKILNIPAYLVVYNELEDLYVWSFQEEKEWRRMTLMEFTYHLAGLRNKRLIRSYKKETNMKALRKKEEKTDGAIS